VNTVGTKGKVKRSPKRRCVQKASIINYHHPQTPICLHTVPQYLESILLVNCTFHYPSIRVFSPQRIPSIFSFPPMTLPSFTIRMFVSNSYSHPFVWVVTSFPPMTLPSSTVRTFISNSYSHPFVWVATSFPPMTLPSFTVRMFVSNSYSHPFVWVATSFPPMTLPSSTVRTFISNSYRWTGILDTFFCVIWCKHVYVTVSLTHSLAPWFPKKLDLLYDIPMLLFYSPFACISLHSALVNHSLSHHLSVGLHVKRNGKACRNCLIHPCSVHSNSMSF
jgi:hypothetical protein